jgi:hypothetical protein
MGGIKSFQVLCEVMSHSVGTMRLRPYKTVGTSAPIQYYESHQRGTQRVISPCRRLGAVHGARFHKRIRSVVTQMAPCTAATCKRSS